MRNSREPEVREQLCFYCGDSLGLYIEPRRPPLDNCGKRECLRAALDCLESSLEEWQMRNNDTSKPQWPAPTGGFGGERNEAG